jgi:hypothetical protein
MADGWSLRPATRAEVGGFAGDASFGGERCTLQLGAVRGFGSALEGADLQS